MSEYMLEFTPLEKTSIKGCKIDLLYRKSGDQVGGSPHSQQHLPPPLPFPAILTFARVGALLANIGLGTNEPQTSPAVQNLVGPGLSTELSTSHRKLPLLCPPLYI